LTTFKRNFSFNKNIKEIVSKNIKKYRLDAGITQEQLAVDIGKSYDFVRRLEFKKGEIGCSLDTLYRISVVLNQPMGKFFEEKWNVPFARLEYLLCHDTFSFAIANESTDRLLWIYFHYKVLKINNCSLLQSKKYCLND